MTLPDDLPERIGTASPVPAAFQSQVGPLLPMSIMTLLDEAAPWLRKRVHMGLALVPGSIDSWAALDFSAWLNDSAGSLRERYWDVERDAPIYADRELEVALLFNRRTTSPTQPVLAVGMRFQSLRVPTARFTHGVEAELGRLDRELRRAEFAEAERHLLAVTMDGAGLAACLSLGLELRGVHTEGQAILWKGFRR